MIKGAQKQMIVVRTGDSLYFDEAYFVLRREICAIKEKDRDMLSEANRILEQTEPSGAAKPKKRLSRGAFLFLLGLLCGGLAVLVITLLL